jgi:hypothetical protein
VELSRRYVYEQRNSTVVLAAASLLEKEAEADAIVAPADGFGINGHVSVGRLHAPVSEREADDCS